MWAVYHTITCQKQRLARSVMDLFRPGIFVIVEAYTDPLEVSVPQVRGLKIHQGNPTARKSRALPRSYVQRSVCGGNRLRENLEVKVGHCQP